MATKDNYTKSLHFSLETNTKLGRLALEHCYSKFQFFNQLVEYFHHIKKDPADLNDELLKRTLSRNHYAYTSFIKTQESIANPHASKCISEDPQSAADCDHFNELVITTAVEEVINTSGNRQI